MRAAFATLVFAGLAVANPMPQAVTSAIAPQGTPPAGCYPNYSGTFEVGPINVTSSGSDKRELDKRNTQLGITLQNGILTDPQGRTGYIAANEQFQFDGPPQAGAIWTAGFTVCTDGRLTLGSDQIWWRCLSGDFYNLYFTNQGGQCIKSYLIAQGVDGAGGPVPGTVTGTAIITATTGGTGTVTGTGTSSSANATITSSTAASNSTVVITGSSTTYTTVIGGGHNSTATTATTGVTKTTVVGHQTTTTAGGQKTTTTTGGGGSPTTGGSAASSSSSPAAAPLATLRGEMFGLAAGVLALVAL